ncbi:MAG: response regulator, partial [Ghiorsea sp.]
QAFSQQIHHYGQVRNFKVELKAANKQRVFVSIYAKLNHDEHGQVSGIEGIISDHTQVKQSENSMYLLINQLRKARDTARASNQEKTKFLSLVSHELRTPIHGLMGMQEMLMMDKQGLSQEQQDYLVASQQATLAISHLLHDMISMTDTQPAHVEKQAEEVELAPFLCAMMNCHSHAVKEKELDYCLILADVPSVIEVNVSKLRQVLFNLLSYAIKSAVAGGLSLEVSVAHGRLCFKVTYLHTVQEERMQSQARLESLKDSSLEMMLIYGCLGMLNGSMQMDSDGRSTTMTFDLVMVVSHKSLLNLSLMADHACHIQLFGDQNQEKQAVNNPSLRILLAEDDKISRMIALKRLKRAGFDVLAVNDGLQAWQALQREHFDLLLTDIRMPALDGLALTKKIRTQEEGTAKHLHILGLSAHALQVHIDAYLAAGMDNFLSKPLEPSELLMHIPEAQEVA